MRLPLFVPDRTRELTSDIDATVVAAGLRDLLTRHRASPARSSPHLTTAEAVRRSLHVPRAARVMGVLNGRDDVLEAFWGSKRGEFYQALERAAIQMVTGPTFSILAESFNHPAYHNVTMARRHHRVIQELYGAGNSGIPNVYWRNETERQRWIEFLKSADIDTISRDFSRTKQMEPFREHLDGLLDLIRAVDRPMHIILLGVGAAKAHHALPRLLDAGGSCTVVSAEPIMQAIKRGAELRETPSGKLLPVRRLEIPRMALAVSNLSAFQDHLIRACGSGHSLPELYNASFRQLDDDAAFAA